MNQIKSWNEFKTIISALSGRLIHHKEKDYYHVYFIHGQFACFIALREGTSEYSEFEASYKVLSNISAADDDGDLLVRHKIVPRGWSYRSIGINLTTSNSSSLEVFRNWIPDPTINTSYKMIDTQGDDTNTGALAVRTEITIEPTYDYFVVSGKVSKPNEKILMDSIVAPDVPEIMGGSHHFAQNIDISMFDSLVTDGKAPKILKYNATYHTNKIKFSFKHSQGIEKNLSIILEVYKK